MKNISINTIFLSFIGIGFIPIASGTFGSLAGVILGYGINIIDFKIFYFLIPLLLILGIISMTNKRNHIFLTFDILKITLKLNNKFI